MLTGAAYSLVAGELSSAALSPVVLYVKVSDAESGLAVGTAAAEATKAAAARKKRPAMVSVY